MKSLIVKLSGKRQSDSMQGMAGRDPEFHIRPLLFQITSLPCPAIHCSDDEDYSGSGSDNEQSHHHDEEYYDDDIDYSTNTISCTHLDIVHSSQYV